MAMEIQWEADEPREWRAAGPESLRGRAWQAVVTTGEHRYAWSLVDRRFGYVEVQGEETTAEAAKAAVQEAVVRNEVAFRPDTPTGWPDAMRRLLEASQGLAGVTDKSDPGLVAQAADEYRAACERARRLLK